MIKKESEPAKPKSVTIQLKTILKTPKCEFAPSSSKKILDSAQTLLKSLDTYRQNIDVIMVATYRSIKASRQKVKQLITLLERRVRYYMEASDESGVKSEDGDTKGIGEVLPWVRSHQVPGVIFNFGGWGILNLVYGAHVPCPGPALLSLFLRLLSDSNNRASASTIPTQLCFQAMLYQAKDIFRDQAPGLYLSSYTLIRSVTRVSNLMHSIDAFNNKTSLNLDRIKSKLDEELSALSKAEDLLKEARDKKVDIEQINTSQVVLEGVTQEVKQDFKERIAWVVKALQVQDVWLMLVKLRKNDDNHTHAIVRLRQGCLEQLHTLKMTDQTKGIFAVHQDRLIAGQSIFTYSNSTLTYLMIFGESSMTDVIGLTDSYLLMGLKKYYTVNLWKQAPLGPREQVFV